MMDAAFKEKWIEALESGHYSQTHLELQNEDGFCCLGVACDLVDSKGWHKHNTYKVYYIYIEGERVESSHTSIPSDLRVKLGISYEQCEILMKLNDIDKKTFPEIAQWIRENL